MAFSLASYADTVYTYTGNMFTTIASGFTCPPLCNVGGEFTVAQPLAPNLAAVAVDPVSFNLAAGSIDVTSGSDSITVSTDSSGNISAWSWTVIGPTGNLQARIITQNGGAGGANFDDIRLGNNPAPFVGPVIASVFSNPGSWSQTTSTSVPEPSAITLLITALVAAVFIRFFGT